MLQRIGEAFARPAYLKTTYDDILMGAVIIFFIFAIALAMALCETLKYRRETRSRGDKDKALQQARERNRGKIK